LGLLRVLQASSEWTQQQLLRVLPNNVAVVASGMSTLRRRGSNRGTGTRSAWFQAGIARQIDESARTTRCHTSFDDAVVGNETDNCASSNRRYVVDRRPLSIKFS